MSEFIYGPIASRRLGLSLGINPIPRKVCNYSCVYCQVGKTIRLINKRMMFYPIEELITAFENSLSLEFDVVTIAGDGEPTLYLGLGELIVAIKKRTTKPVVVITNGGLLYDVQVQNELLWADIVMPSLDAYNELSFSKINRHAKSISFKKMYKGLHDFSKRYQGQLWLEIMIMQDINDDDQALTEFKNILQAINYQRLYINTPVRPSAVSEVTVTSHHRLQKFADELQGIAIDVLSPLDYASGIKDDYQAIISIIKRHPLDIDEIIRFLITRKNDNKQEIIKRLDNDETVENIEFNNRSIYRFK